MLVSIIIPAYNGAATLPECLAACLAQDYPTTEVIVVDDGSTDETAAIAAAFAGVTLVTQENGGPSVARNHGARAAKGEILVYTDADCVPRKDWVSALLAPFDEGVVAVGGTYDIANSESRLARVVQAEISVRHAQFDGDVDFLGSFNVAYRADSFHQVGGFEESYRQASGEDNDLAYKLQDAGGRLRFTQDAIVAHYHPERLGAYLRTQSKHGYWRVKLYRDHPKRAQGGDQYAGLPDLIAPAVSLPVALGLPFPIVLSLTDNPAWPAWLLHGALLAFYGALHIPIARRLRSRLSRADLLYCWFMLCVRDFARVLGLFRGLWVFGLQRGGAA